MTDSVTKVEFRNTMNRLQFHGFTETDFDLLMTICSRMRNLGEKTQTIEYSFLMDLCGWDRHQGIALFHEHLKQMVEKLRHVGATMDANSDEFISFNLFSTFRGNKQKRILTVRVNPEFAYILNDLTANFTRFELAEYVGLDGRYSKMLYQRLKQFKKTGWWETSIEDIRRELDIPETYLPKHIMDKVIKPSLHAIQSCKGFSDLTVEVLRSSRQGRAVTGYKFSWTASGQVPGQMNLADVLKNQENKKRKNAFNDYPQHNDSSYDNLERFIANH